MERIRMETSWVVGISRALGGSGDPSPVTALGVFSGLRASIEHAFGKDSYEDLKIAIQGVGHVGSHLVGHLVRAGARVVVADVDPESVERVVEQYNVEAVAPDAIYDVDCDVFAPCAMGGSINAKTIPRLKCKVVAGAANNQLGSEHDDGAALAERGIFYAPDFVINAGGLINVANELEGYNQERALNQAQGIYRILTEVFARAARDNIPTWRAANNLAMDRIESVGRLRRTWTGTGSALRGIA
jgi:leucine dehydrogenase